jgi:hypothetical protein
MGCNCGKRQQVVLNPKPIIEEFNTEEIDGNILVPTPTDMTYDWYNNIDEIRPYTQEDYLNDELRKWNGGQTRN